MELKPGYKQTEVGVIPEDWMLQPLSYLTILMTNGFVGPVKSHYTKQDDGVLYIQGYNIEENSFNFNGIKYVTLEFHKKQSKSCLREGDLLTIQTGDVGLTSYVQSELAGSNCHALIITRFKKDKYIPKFFSYYLNSHKGRTRLKEIETGTTMKHINVGDMVQFLVPYPPTKAEQTAIANALSDTDALIQSLTRFIAKKRQIKQGAMQTLLTGEKRLPMFVKSMNYQNTDIGIIPEDWDCVAMGDIGQSLIGLTYNPSNVKDYGTLVLRSSNVQGGQLAFENNVFVDMELPKRVMVEPDDILICVRNGSRQLIGKCALIDDRVKGAAFGAFMSVYRSKYSRFIFYQFQSHIIQKQIEEVMGATINQITNKDLSVFKVALPKNEEEQARIATILSDMDTEIAALEAKLAKYRHIKQGMMQNLLTGRIRLVKPESNTGAVA